MLPMSALRQSARFVIAVTALAALACGSDDACSEGPFGGVTCTLDGQITTGDAVLFNGEVLVYTALAVYGFGPGLPAAVLWTVSDATVLDVETLPDLSASVTAIDTGTAWIYALINAEYLDSALVTVVLPGAARWRSVFSGVAAGAYPAIGADSGIRVVTGGATPQLRLFTSASGTGTSTASCFSALGPSLGASDVAYATGAQCTRRHSSGGDSTWSAPVGSAALGIAVAEDGGAITVSADSVYRVSAAGVIRWGQPLRGTVRTAPVIGPGGDVYVGWSAAGADSVSRFGLDSTPRWSVAVPGLSTGTPAVWGGRLIFGRPGGLFALDSTGVVSWNQTFPGASATSRTSSPVHDDIAIFVQNEEALYSYAIGGAFLWVADSLGYGTTTGLVGAPALMTDLSLVVPCQSAGGGREVCAVRQVDGRLSWRSPLGGGSAEGLAVGRDGTIYTIRTLTSGGSELVAMWGRVAPSIVGWPAEGGNPQHTRRR